MTSRTGRTRSNGRIATSGFTLIELILVMALIVIIASIVTPQMSNFFRGRTLNNEARRFMTLTRYAENRAVAEGVPMLLWIDEQSREYGLEAQPGYLEKDDKAVEYQLADDLQIEVGDPISPYGTTSQYDTTTTMQQPVMANLPTNRRYIRFSPDGFINLQSPEMILIRRDQNDVVAIGPSRNWQSYEIFTNNIYASR